MVDEPPLWKRRKKDKKKTKNRMDRIQESLEDFAPEQAEQGEGQLEHQVEL
jgi:hypothetical protein